MLGKKIVARYKDGSIQKGYTSNFNPDKDFFHLSLIDEATELPTGEVVEVNVSILKAVFFVKSFKGDKEYIKVRTFDKSPAGPPSQRRIILIFKDGENFYGSTLSYSPRRSGFFVFPIDNQDNSESVFVPQGALEKVHIKKFGSEEFDIYLYEN
jgi:hypothetical protein